MVRADAAHRKDKALAETARSWSFKKSSRHLGRRGRRHGAEERRMTLALVDEALAQGTTVRRACRALGLSPRTVARGRA
jgi:hypothetical protein